MNVQMIDTPIKKEDDTKKFKLQLLDDANKPFVLVSGIHELELDIELSKDNVLEKEVGVEIAEEGIVIIDVSDLTAGMYNCEIIVRSANQIITFPTNGYFSVQINKNLPKE